jgi:hypothetical protein
MLCYFRHPPAGDRLTDSKFVGAQIVHGDRLDFDQIGRIEPG